MKQVSKYQNAGTIFKSVSENNSDRRPRTRTESGEFICYNCIKSGHISKDCTEPRRELKCLKCNGIEHTQRHCTVQVSTKKSEVNVIHTSSDSTIREYIKSISVGGVMRGVLIDPGASVCTIKATVVVMEDLITERDKITFQGFGSQSVKTVSPVCRHDNWTHVYR